jgi:ferritin-like metal-binding protein YciE
MTAYGERMARVEVEVRELKKAFEEHKAETNVALKALDEKLNDLLALRNKGAGVVWLVSGLIGTGIIGAILQAVAWLRG